jgi:signal peptidase I
VLVKRLVGMPGDTLYMRDGLVYVNGIAQRQGYGAAANPKGDPNETSPLFDWQHKIELRNTRFGSAPAQPTHDNWGPLLIPQGHYFMMGDNRYESKDSRYWGVVPRANVRGRPIFVYYSFVPSSESDRPLSFLTDIRWGRIGHVIH